ncbi:hypothetical protein Goklo_023683 [Gossypium klotzschianum]|uniref:Thioredoxin-like fold domain-containing protein n=1 Tax=Gossypium klotzschianum TaxID=34286 RepID=A0A7J8TRC4_9ROSI|nr:hypothetical protein [Gossypium klotzschianum]
MLSFQIGIFPKSFLPLCLVKNNHNSRNMLPVSDVTRSTLSHWCNVWPSCVHHRRFLKTSPCFATSRKPDSNPDPDPNPDSKPKSKAETGNQDQKSVVSHNKDENPDKSFPTTIPKKPRRGRRSEAVAVEDFIRDSLEQTFESIRQQNPEVFENKESVMKDRLENQFDCDSSSDEDEDEDEKDSEAGKRGKKMVVEEDDPDWPLDADIGWGIRASEYFEQHAIKNVVGEDGFEIDWEGEIDDSWVKEINCLEWESFAFHPSPLIVLVFERYKRATHNWKTLKELEKAIQVYWNSKDRLPPRLQFMYSIRSLEKAYCISTLLEKGQNICLAVLHYLSANDDALEYSWKQAVKLDINIERDLAYALKVRECPQLLFLRGNRIMYREKEFRKADELVQMIAYFYYNAKKPAWIDEASICRPY